eukprot:GILI01001278.1.p1 GENE.GILI01001278.1~~GILI01001278.1.p1  ORF type:complete len:892 (-),score=306.49 GILI01001278.1:32-2707(-)
MLPRRVKKQVSESTPDLEEEVYEMSSDRTQPSIIRIPPYNYIWVLDNNTNVTRVECGPRTFTRQEHERVVSGPEAMIRLPPRHFCQIADPVVMDDSNNPALDKSGQIKLRHGDVEIRTADRWPDPFPLFPGERLIGSIEKLIVLASNTALRLRATRDFEDGSVHRYAGDEWLHVTPVTYVPRVEVEILETVKAEIIKPNKALKLRARKECEDKDGESRKAGEEWLVREAGAYMPQVDEEVVEHLSAYVLTEKKALHLRATRTFTDVYKTLRKAGEEWLVTFNMAETHLKDVYEEIVGEVKITTLTNRQYCVILDPLDGDSKPQHGTKKLVKGEAAFFLRPGERLESGIQGVHVLSEDEALLLKATEGFDDAETKERHQPGDKWMIYGPRDYIPPVEVQIVEMRRTIPLDENEGIYVRDTKTGRVRAVSGQTYMLKAHEELWEKELPETVEVLLAKQRLGDVYVPATVASESAENEEVLRRASKRDKTKVVTFRASHNAAVQVYDYKAKTSRVVFGPGLVMLGPDEQFTVMSLSGDKPKRPNVIKSLTLMLGPDFMTDIVIVETSDHARLSLQLSYNWHFEVNKDSEDDAQKIFQVRDFTGDACKAIASRVRGAVASVTFEDFHKHSAKIIRGSVFGYSDSGKVNPHLRFEANNLVVTNIDIQSVEPVDQRTRDSLQKSVQLAIEITTKSQEATARHEAERLEQEAKGRLERQKIADQAEAEAARKKLLQLQAESAAVETSGQATAEARARAEAAEIEGMSSLKQAEFKAQAVRFEAQAELEQLKAKQEAEIAHRKALDDLEIHRERELAGIEGKKIQTTIDAIGRDTIISIASAGPELQAKLLQSLGLQGFLVMDGKNPINLFSTANGLLGNAGTPGGASSSAVGALPSTL